MYSNISRSNLLFPLRFYISYIFASLLLFAFGPYPWPTRSSLELFAFMGSAILAIYLGYKKGIFKKPGNYYGKFTAVQLYRISLYLTLILFYPTFIYRAGSAININMDMLTNPASYYLQSHSAEDHTGTAYIEYVRIVLSVFLQLLIPLLIVYWERISVIERMLGIIAVFLNVILWISVGTNKGIGDIVIILFWSLLIRNQNNIFKKICFVAVPLVMLFFIFFTQGQITRHDKENVQDTLYFFADVGADRNNLMVRYLPPFAQEGAIAFTSYLVQGYNGLALCLNEPYVPTFGLGNSMFTATYADKYLGTDIAATTYPARSEKTTGWESGKQWNTIFPWLASDLTFPGSIFMIGVFSFLFALSWTDSLQINNPYALSMFIQLAIMFTYISANNQIFQSGEGYFGFIGTLFLWVYTRYRFIFR